MPASRHVMILASAGSGKTFALTNRYLSLLAAGARPERIVALTFTRKAAGEFFDEILAKLARAAADPTAASELAGQIGCAESGTAPFLRLLRQMVEAMPQLRLGTLDGFFARIVRSFPLELGLTGDFEMLEEHGARVERQRVLQRMLARTAGGVDQAQKDFIEAFKQATFGREEKRLVQHLDRYLDDHHGIFLDAAEAEIWGEAERIWPEGSRWGEAEQNPEGALRVLRDWYERTEMTPGQRGRWIAFAEAVAAWRPGAVLVKAMEYLLEKTLAALEDLDRGEATLLIDRKKQTVTGPAAEALAAVAMAIISGELTRRLAMTRGIFEVLHRYEEFYHDAVRRGGKLTFADVQRLLEPARWSSGAAPGGDDSVRWTIDYRLDGQIDHWLFDEFQDTSYGQWQILRNLVDEVVQDPTQRRSFFAVGDVKQAIYGWRGGDSRLFREIFQQYNAAAPGTIGEEHLDQSWRSGPPIIELVNGVFGAKSEIAELFPGEASRRWNSEWRTHQSALPGRDGQAALLQADDEAGRRELTRDLLHELRPVERGLTCAVLVLSNREALGIAEYLRSEGSLPAVAESDEKVCVDHPAGAALAALVQAAAHPGDELAWQHVLMSPLAALLAEDRVMPTREAISLRLLTELAAEGFALPLERWLRRLERFLAPDDEFSRERARQFAAAARDFDGTGSRDPSEFLEFIGRYELRMADSGTKIQVMTVHKSKGLGFDLVILPALQGKTLNQRRDGLAVRKTAERAVDWILDFPSEMFWSADPVLRTYVEEAQAEACYEKLSLLYVALTRAKRGLYVITEPVGTSTSKNFPRLLADALGREAAPVRVGQLTRMGVWSAGNPDWAAARAAAKAPAVSAAGIAPVWELTPVIRRAARRPSADAGESPLLGPIFNLEANGALDFGREVHALLASVEWANAAQRSALAKEWGGARPPGALAAPSGLPARPEVALHPQTEASAVLLAPDLAGIWEKPPGRSELWRERAFEAILGETWVTGLFDRVIVQLDSAGKPISAVVYDFKTDRLIDDSAVAAALARHDPQLGWYRMAVQSLTGLPLEAIRAEIVFTRRRERQALPGLVPKF